MISESDVFNSMQGSLLAPEQETALISGSLFRTANIESFKNVLRARRSIRVYTGEAIPEEILREKCIFSLRGQ